ncbi:unnamed protein product, partial [Didymodactylos carnosus]
SISKQKNISLTNCDSYMKAALPGSINFPYDQTFNEKGDLLDQRLSQIIEQNRALVKVVIGNKNHSQTVKFANNLIHNNWSRVCILHKGIEVFKSTDLLYVPTPSDIL